MSEDDVLFAEKETDSVTEMVSVENAVGFDEKFHVAETSVVVSAVALVPFSS